MIVSSYRCMLAVSRKLQQRRNSKLAPRFVNMERYDVRCSNESSTFFSIIYQHEWMQENGINRYHRRKLLLTARSDHKLWLHIPCNFVMSYIRSVKWFHPRKVLVVIQCRNLIAMNMKFDMRLTRKLYMNSGQFEVCWPRSFAFTTNH